MLLFNACDTTEEKYLYSKSDSEYATLLAMAVEKCINEANIFDSLNATGNFETAGMLGKIYKIVQDASPQVTLYTKIIAVSATEMQVAVNSADSSYDKIILFEKVDHDAILNELKIMACNSTYAGNFSAGGLSSTTAMSLTWNKRSITLIDGDDADTEPDAYNDRKDAYTISTSFPLFFFYYNATKTKTIKAKDTDAVVTTSKITITDVTEATECDPTDSDNFKLECDFSAGTTGTFTSCPLEVATGKYSTNAFGDEIINLGGLAGCNLLPSTI